MNNNRVLKWHRNIEFEYSTCYAMGWLRGMVKHYTHFLLHTHLETPSSSVNPSSFIDIFRPNQLTCVCIVT